MNVRTQLQQAKAWLHRRRAIGVVEAIADVRRRTPDFDAVRDRIRQGGTDSLSHFGNGYTHEGGLLLQQNPDEFAALAVFLRERGPHAEYMEIGSASGGACLFLYREVGFRRVLSLDNGEHPRAVAQAEHFSHIENFKQYLGDSHADAARLFLEAEVGGPLLDVAFIDGDHSYEGVWQDIELTRPFCRPGALMILHDTVACDEVKQAWFRVVEDGYVRPLAEFIGEERPLGIAVGEVLARAGKLAPLMPLKNLIRSLSAPPRRAAHLLARHKVIPPSLQTRLRRAYRGLADASAAREDRRRLSELGYTPTFSLLTYAGAGGHALRETLTSLRRQSYPNWELCVAHEGGSAGRAALRAAASDARVKAVRVEAARGAAAALNEALAVSSGEFVGVVEAGDALASVALSEVARLLGANPEADFVYTDEEVWTASEPGPRVLLKPDWSPEYFLSRMYTGRLSVYRRPLVAEAGGFRPGFGAARDYDLALRVVEKTGRVEHVPRVLYRGPARGGDDGAALRALRDHVARGGLDAVCEPGLAAGLFRVRRGVRGEPLASVVIPTAGYKRVVGGRELDLLANCVRSIVSKTDYANYEVVCVDNGDLRAETVEALEGCGGGGRVRRVTFEREGPFNLAVKMNFGAGHARGEHLLFLNDDIEVVSPGWMTAMLEHSQQPEVGVVGAKLIFPGGAIQHAGVRLYPGGAPGHLYYNFPREQQALAPDLDAVRNYSIVTGACMMTRAALFRELGGFDARFPVNYNDADYCLRARARGLRVVYTPYAELYHFESVSRAKDDMHGVSDEEIERFCEVWGPETAGGDPYHNLLLDSFCFRHTPGASL